MSKRKQRPILGPDGKPVDMAALRKKAAPETSITVDGKPLSDSVSSYTFQISHDLLPALSSMPSVYESLYGKSAPKRTLADAVGDEVAALTAGFDGMGKPELPVVKRDLDTYDGAFASAASNCVHENAIEMLYGRQWTCDDCGRSIDRAEMLRARKKRGGPFSWFFGG